MTAKPLTNQEKKSIELLHSGSKRYQAYIGGHVVAKRWKQDTVIKKADKLFNSKAGKAYLKSLSEKEVSIPDKIPDSKQDTPDTQDSTDVKELPPLTPKQERFCMEYIIDLNATQAAIRAGYSKKTAGVQSHELLKKPNIQNFVASRQANVADSLGITATRVLDELGKMGFGDIRSIFSKTGALISPVDMDDDAAASIQSIEVVTKPCINAAGEKDVEHIHKIKLADKKGSLELIGKHLKLFTDKVEHTGRDGGPIEHKEITPDMSPEEAQRIYKEGLGNE